MPHALRYEIYLLILLDKLASAGFSGHRVLLKVVSFQRIVCAFSSVWHGQIRTFHRLRDTADQDVAACLDEVTNLPASLLVAIPMG